ncbi:MAG: hypothetical protein IJ719_19680 [Clostridia bacterium]|nr:hypothetical protein [Clostridia bacterium]
MVYSTVVVALSSEFYNLHPQNDFPEILHKEERPYNCLCFSCEKDYSICIPFRTNMSHRFGYRFRKSARSRNNLSGLDYTKIVIINDDKYISQIPAVVDNDEFTEMMQNIDAIVNGALAYVENYVNHKKGSCVLDQQVFERRYGRSSIQYFDDILLEDNS